MQKQKQIGTVNSACSTYLGSWFLDGTGTGTGFTWVTCVSVGVSVAGPAGIGWGSALAKLATVEETRFRALCNTFRALCNNVSIL